MRAVTGQQFSTECERTREYLSAALDGELSEVEGAALDGHLAACADCRAYAARSSSITRVVRTTPLQDLGFAITLPSRRFAVARKLQVAAAAAALVATVGLSAVVGSIGSTHASRHESQPAASTQSIALRSPEAELKLLHATTEARARLAIHSRIAL